MTIRGKLYTFVSLLTVMLLGISYFALFITMDILSKSEHIYEEQLRGLALLGQSERQITSLHLSVTDSLLADPGSPLPNSPGDTRKALEFFQGYEDAVNLPAEESTSLVGFEPAFQRWQGLLEDIRALLTREQKDQALSVFQGDYNAAHLNLLALLSGLSEQTAQSAQTNYTQVRHYGWTLLVFYNIYAGIGIVLGLLILWTVHTTVLKPIRQVTTRVTQLSSSEGDLTMRLPIQRRDEMTQLAGNLNSFIDKTETILLVLRNALLEANQVKSGIMESIRQNSSSAVQISANIASIADQITTMERVVTQATQAAQDVHQGVTIIEEQIINQAAMAQESTASVGQMIESIQRLSRIAQDRQQGTSRLSTTLREGEEKVQGSLEAVQTMHDDIDSILSMVKLISGIASQTNLLAMNAAIEAAHAGDAGRGFAVVADEIRKLAETSSQQSQSISTVLSGIVEKIKSALDATQFTSRVYEGIQSEVHTLTSAFQDITDNTQEMNQGGSQVLQAMEQLNHHSQTLTEQAQNLGSSNQKITAIMEHLGTISSFVDQSIGEINQGMQAIADSMESLNALSAGLDQSLEAADQNIGRFKLSEPR